MRPSRLDDAIVAYHEAGHGLVAWQMGLRILSLTINRVGDDHGRAHVGRGCLEDEAVVWLAGAVAQQMFAPGSTRGDLKDIEEAKNRAAQLLPVAYSLDDVDELILKLQRKAQFIIEGHKDHLETLASALLEKRELSGKEVEQILLCVHHR